MHLITGLPTGGAEIMLTKLLAAMERAKFEPIVISLQDVGAVGSRIQSMGIPTYALGIRLTRPSVRPILNLRRIVQRARPDLIQGWMYHGNLAALLGRWTAGIRMPVLWNIRYSLYDPSVEHWPTASLIRLGAYFSRRADAIIYNSHVSAAQHEVIGYSGARRYVIPNGFDCESLKPESGAHNRLRRELRFTEDVLLIGHIARFHPMKDHGNFISAAGRIAKCHRSLGFVFVGPGVDETNRELIAMIESAGIKPQSRLLGERHDIARILAGLDILTSPSWGEAFPNVVGEAMACGVPCIVTDVGDSSRLVGATGVVVPPKNPEALADGWERLIRLGHEGRMQLGRAARARIVERYSMATITKEYERMYETLIHEQ